MSSTSDQCSLNDVLTAFLIPFVVFLFATAFITTRLNQPLPKFPEVFVSSFDVVSSSNQYDPDSFPSSFVLFSVNVTVRNPNKTSKNELRAAVFYDGKLIAETSVTPFHTRLEGNVSDLNAEL